jgi:hypothetical protein
MALCYGLNNKPVVVNDFFAPNQWEPIPKNEWDYEHITYEECIESRILPIRSFVADITEVFPDVKGIYPEGEDFEELHFSYDEDDVLSLRPHATYISYPLESDDDEYGLVELDTEEKAVFDELLANVIGDKHSSAEQAIMTEFHHAWDKCTSDFIRDVLDGRDVTPLTVGFVDSTMAKVMKDIVDEPVCAKRIVMNEDFVYLMMLACGMSIAVSAGHDARTTNTAAAPQEPNRSIDEYIHELSKIGYILANRDSVYVQPVPPSYNVPGLDKKRRPFIIVAEKTIGDIVYNVSMTYDKERHRCVVEYYYSSKAEKSAAPLLQS